MQLQRSVHPTPGRSGLPLPSTAKKPTPLNMRMSTAGPPVRALPRQSLYPQNATQLLQSTTKPNYGQQLNNSTRRTSVWQGASQPPSGSQTSKDPRPLRDKPYQAKQKQFIISFLQSIGYEYTREAMNNMTGKEYRNIFNYLITWLDPDYRIGHHAKFEEEFIPTLKAFRYPYVNAVDSKWLSAPASMHCWPPLLGVLTWLVERSMIRLDHLDSGHPSLLDFETIPEQFDHPLYHVALGSYHNETAYHLWLNTDDEDFVEPRQVIENRYAKKDEKVKEEITNLAERLRTLEHELKKLRASATPLVELQKTNNILKQDDQKFDTILRKYEAQIKKKKDQLQREKDEHANAEIQHVKLQPEKQRLAAIVESQNLSQQEVIRMNSDHESLSRTLEELRQRIEEAHQNLMTLEVNNSNRASAAEDEVEAYMALLSSLNMFPPLPPPFEDLDLTMDLNPAAPNQQQLLNGPDIREVIKPTILKIAEMRRNERASLGSEQLKVENELDKLTSECETMEESIADVERMIEHVNEKADDIREASQRDAMVNAEEVDKFERELARVRTAALASGMGIKTHLQAVQFAAREQEDKISRLRDETIRAVIKNGSDIAAFKDEISRHLAELRECAEAEEA